MSNLLKIIIIMLLIYISYINYNYVKVGWCESEIQILRDQSSALIDNFKIEMED
mgnify:FL=1